MNNTPDENFIDWQQRMADLVGLEEEHNFSEQEPGNVSTTNSNNESSPNPNQGQQSQKSLSSNPFAKVAVVGTTTLLGVLVAGAFLSQLMGGSNRQSKKIIPENNLKDNARLNKLEEARPEEEIETLKTKLALAEQARAVKAAQMQLRTTQPNTSRIRARSNPNPIAQPRTEPRTRVVVQRVPTPARTVYVPRIVTVERVVRVPQKVTVQQKATPNVSSQPIQPQTIQAQSVQSPPVTPEATQPFPQNTPTPSPTPALPNTTTPPPPTEQAITNSSQPPQNNTVQSPPTTTNNSVNSTDSTSNLIQRLVASRNSQTSPITERKVAVGTSVKAELATALFGEANKSSNSNSSSPKNDNTFVVRLKEPLKTTESEVALPAGTELLAQISNLSENGMVDLRVVSVVFNDNGKVTQQSLQENAMKIKAPNGKPLIASKYPDSSGGIASMDTGLFVLGGVGKVAELFNRTQSEVIPSNGGNIVVQRNPSTNILTGVLEGGMNSLVPQITLRNQKAISEMMTQNNVWFLGAGTEVEVYINQLMQFETSSQETLKRGNTYYF
ncbi:MAG: hypothetical protein KME64_04275 [Scytonematopsis contorta HA4267-MV1]|jgi:hypothetical protein|nr:hypothetical protein [Scytonematopsis contorta HA4267-MV1]